MPHQAAGIRTLPPVSDPRPTVAAPAATATAVPPLEPPATDQDSGKLSVL